MARAASVSSSMYADWLKCRIGSPIVRSREAIGSPKYVRVGHAVTPADPTSGFRRVGGPSWEAPHLDDLARPLMDHAEDLCDVHEADRRLREVAFYWPKLTRFSTFPFVHGDETGTMTSAWLSSRPLGHRGNRRFSHHNRYVEPSLRLFAKMARSSAWGFLCSSLPSSGSRTPTNGVLMSASHSTPAQRGRQRQRSWSVRPVRMSGVSLISFGPQRGQAVTGGTPTG
jgi:hypothetical protein